MHFIPHVNRSDLLVQALYGVRDIIDEVTVIDNSDDPNSLDGIAAIMYRPDVPLSFHQLMNRLYRFAKKRKAPYFGFQHEDAVPADGVVKQLYAKADELLTQDGKHTCVVGNTGLTCAVMFTKAFDEIGLWDTRYPNGTYHSDIDWFLRSQYLGYSIYHMDLEVKHLDGGSVTMHEPSRKRVHDMTFRMNEIYHTAKWGGTPGHETFRTPWNE